MTVADERVDDLRGRLSALEDRVETISGHVQIRGPEIAHLRDEVYLLRDKYHELVRDVAPFVLLRTAIVEVPTRLGQLEVQLQTLTQLPATFDAFRVDFFTFKGKILGAMLIASVCSPILTGMVLYALLGKR